MQRLLRVLDHPQAADIIQRAIYSKSTEKYIKCDNEGWEDDKACSRCSTMISILSSTTPQRDGVSMDWSHHTLQRIVEVGSLEEGSALLSSLSSTAMHNLLVLLERNIRLLPREELGEFIKNIELLPFVHEDEWCGFLIQCLRRHIHETQNQHLVDFEDVTSKMPPPSAQLDVSVQQADTSVRSSDKQVIEELQTGDAITSEPEEALAPSPQALRPPSPHLFEADSEDESLPEENEEVKNTPTDEDFITKMAQVHCQWKLSKAANQEDFNYLCSLDNNKFLECLKCFNEASLPDACITAISDNIASLPSELSYHNAVSFLHSVVLPMVVNLKQTAPRALTSALTSINSQYPDAMVPGLIIPIFRWHLFGAVHGNLLVKLFQDSEPDQLSSIWQKLAEIQVDSNGGSFYWNEDVVSVLLVLFQRGVNLGEDEASVRTLITALQRNAPSLIKSSKFAKLVMEICKSPQYQGLVSNFHSELSGIASTHKSILKSAMAREVRKLSAHIED